MDLPEANLMDLVAELCQRLRHLVPAATGPEPLDRPPGPLGDLERSALAARVVAVKLRERGSAADNATAEAFEHLALALSGLHTRVGDGLHSDVLGGFRHGLEEFAVAWDGRPGPDLPETWRALRTAGDALYSPDHSTTTEPTTATRSVWLLVTGELRRSTLVWRLEQAGLDVTCPSDAESVLARLDRERPVAVICDDATPARFHRHLRRILPADAPPLVMVRRRNRDRDASGPQWLPPHRAADLLDVIE